MKNYYESFFSKYFLRYFIIAALIISTPIHSMEHSSNWQMAKTVGKVVGGIAGITVLYIGVCMGYTARYRYSLKLKRCKENKAVLPKPAEPKPWAAVEKRYREELQQEEQQIIHRLLATAGASNEQFVDEVDKHVKGVYGHYARGLEEAVKKAQASHSENVSPSIRETIKALLRQQEIDPAIVQIVRDDNAKFNMSAFGGVLSGKACLTVSEPSFDCFSQRFLEHTILHEIQHFKHEDSVLSNVSPLNEKTHAILHEHKLFREKRADILASLNSLEHAESALEYHFVPRFTIPAVWAEIKLKGMRDDDHPDHITRSLYLDKVYREMRAASVEQQKNARVELAAAQSI